MAVRAKVSPTSGEPFRKAPPKKTRQGQGTHSKAKGNKKISRGQGS